MGALHPDEAVELLRRRHERLGARRKEIEDLVRETLAAGVHEMFLVE